METILYSLALVPIIIVLIYRKKYVNYFVALKNNFLLKRKQGAYRKPAKQSRVHLFQPSNMFGNIRDKKGASHLPLIKVSRFTGNLKYKKERVQQYLFSNSMRED